MNTRTLTILKGVPELKDFYIRSLNEGEILIETEKTAISPGTELRCLAGKQVGHNYNLPFIPGYANVGCVVESLSSEFPVGIRVFSGGSLYTGDYKKMWGAHMGHVIAKGKDVVSVPDSVPSELAALSALGAIALHGTKRGGIRPGETVASVGLGAIGSLSALLHKHLGGEVVCCDLSEPRVKLAAEMGLKSFQSQKSMKEGFLELQPKGADLVVDCTGAPSVLSQSLELLAETPWDNSDQPDRRCLIQGSYANDFTVNYDTLFSKQASLIVSRDRQRQDVKQFITFLGEKAFNVQPLISHILPIEEAARGYELLKDPLTTPGTVVFNWKA